MSAKYLIRLDDACPTMYREKWSRIEQILNEFSIHPIVGVVPDNKDPVLNCSYADTGFWDKVKNWENIGWTIALHGLHHQYHTSSLGQTLVPLHNKSEFTGLPFDEQRMKLKHAWSIFKAQAILPTVFMPPSHSCDENTLNALTYETDIRIVTDGLSYHPFIYHDVIWIPQQLWRFYKFPFGVWTICLHPNIMRNSSIDTFKSAIRCFHNNIISLEEAGLQTARQRNSIDLLFHIFFISLLRLKRIRG